MHHVGACVYGFSLVGIERGIGNHRVIALLACCGQRIQRPTVVALPCVRGGCFGVASVGIPCGRLLGVPLLSGDAGLFVGRGIVQCGIGGDVEVGGLHDAGNGRLHCPRDRAVSASCSDKDMACVSVALAALLASALSDLSALSVLLDLDDVDVEEVVVSAMRLLMALL